MESSSNTVLRVNTDPSCRAG